MASTDRNYPRWALIAVPYNQLRVVILARADEEVARHHGAYVVCRETFDLVNWGQGQADNHQDDNGANEPD